MKTNRAREKLQRLQVPKKRRRPTEETDDGQEFSNQNEVTENEEIDHQQQNDENEEPGETIVEFVEGKTQKGTLCLWHQGYCYTKKKINAFRCRNRQCPAVARLHEEPNDGILVGAIEKSHICMPNPAKRKAQMGRQKLREAISNDPRAKPANVLAQTRSQMHNNAFVLLGTDEACQRMMRRERNRKYGNIDRVDIMNLQIPDNLLQYQRDSTSILMYDSRKLRCAGTTNWRGEKDVVFIFAHAEQLDILRKSKRWAVDSTFSAAPKPWAQLFVIGAFVKKRLIVCAQALLPSKDSFYYKEVLQEIRNSINSEPQEVICDFERGEMNALEESFPGVNLSGCTFHFAQSLYKKWRKMGLDRYFGDDEEQIEAAQTTFWEVLSLALVPENKVRQAFATIIERSPEGTEHWLFYVAKYYIGLTDFELELGSEAFRRGTESRTISTSFFTRVSINSAPDPDSFLFGRPSPRPSTPTFSESSSSFAIPPRWEAAITRPPLFPIAFWCNHERARHALEKTNNAMESNHKHFARALSHHPPISSFLLAVLSDVEKQLDRARSAQLHEVNQGRDRRHIAKERRIREILEEEAEWETHDEIEDSLALLGVHMQNYIGNINIREEESDNEE